MIRLPNRLVRRRGIGVLRRSFIGGREHREALLDALDRLQQVRQRR